jgi:ribosome-associated protein
LRGASGIAYDIGSAAANKKAKDIRILDIRDISPIADYFVICSGGSSIQVKAIAEEIEDKMGEQQLQPLHKEGYDSARWILLDYGNVIAHVFHQEDREFYDLERLWADASAISI